MTLPHGDILSFITGAVQCHGVLNPRLIENVALLLAQQFLLDYAQNTAGFVIDEGELQGFVLEAHHEWQSVEDAVVQGALLLDFGGHPLGFRDVADEAGENDFAVDFHVGDEELDVKQLAILA